MHVNLLPVELRLRLQIHDHLRRWSIVWGLLLLSAIVVCYLKYQELTKQHALATELHRRATPYRIAREQATQLRAKWLAAREQEKLVLELENIGCNLALLRAVAQSVADSGHQVQVTSFHAQNIEGEAKRGAQKTSPTNHASSIAPRRLMLMGVGENDSAVTNFTEALRAAGFARVELKSMTSRRAGVTPVAEYNLECSL